MARSLVVEKGRSPCIDASTTTLSKSRASVCRWLICIVIGAGRNLGPAFEREFELLVAISATCGLAHFSSGHADVGGIDISWGG